ncbi:hypothetical protein PYCC9005_005687 [Savitreella phatthalungensis]
MTDNKRVDMIRPYVARVLPAREDDLFTTLSGTVSFIAMFMRNRYFAWLAVFVSAAVVFNSPSDRRSSTYMNVAVSASAVLVAYLPLLLPIQGAV